MNKFSPLQLLLISQVEQFGGLDELTSHLRKYKSHLSVRKQLLIVSTIHYYQCVYSFPMRCELHAVQHRARINREAIILQECMNNRPCESISFLMELQAFSLKYVEKVRRLA